MPSMTRKYCKTTSVKKMGFSQRSSCKAQGFIARTSKKLKGKKVVSQKYRSYKK
jgi:hypothetical protein